MRLRDYQIEAYNKTLTCFENKQTALIVLATGLGKTVVAAHIAEAFKDQGRILLLAHREELIFQGQRTLETIMGCGAEIEMADSWAAQQSFFGANRIVCSTIQTQIAGRDGGRMTRFNPADFSLVILDEAHHGTAASYRKVIDYYRQNADLKLLGLTATPDRADEEALGQIFEDVAFEYDIMDGIDGGWLVPIQQQAVFVEGLDFSQIRTTAGDLNGADLAEVLEFEENLHGMATPILELCGEKRTLIFTATVAQAERMAEILNRHKAGSAEFVSGETPKEYRRSLFERYKVGQFQYLCNVGVLCLDEKTEILTDQGWVGIDGMTYQHRVANWDNGSVFFEEPKFIVRRERNPGERMVSLETKNRSIRVTEDHRMLYRSGHTGEFRIAHAIDLAGKKGELPICGQADPLHLKTDQAKPDTNLKRRIEANSYNLRMTLGLSLHESKTEAYRRIVSRDALRYADPCDLSEDECKFIGFWLGDGSRCNLQSGGVEYTAAQSIVYPEIIAWVDALVGRMGVHVCRRIVNGKNENPHVRWSFPRGTGFGPQERKGLYRIEPYLNKDGSLLFFGLNNQQFDALAYGLWLADGEHGNSTERPACIRVCGINRQLFDTIQAVAVCRGYRANIHQDRTTHQPHHIPLLRLSLSKRSSHSMTKYCLAVENTWKPERVWCVTSTTGNIITRRRGTVTVTGNTEGFDEPGVEYVVMARPTKSRALYSQMVGRATRALPGVVDGPETPDARKAAIAASPKTQAIVVDFVGNAGRHKLIHVADVLGGKYSDEIVELANRTIEKSGKPANIATELVKAEREIDRRRRMRQEAETRAAIRLRASYKTATVNPFDVLDITPNRIPGWHRGRMATDGQRNCLLKFGVNPPPDLSFAHAGQLIEKLIGRSRDHKATFKQVKLLKSRGIDATDLTMKEATTKIDEIAKREGWQQRARTG